jgi:MFS family permease
VVVTDRNIVLAPGTDRTFHRYRILAVLLVPLAMALMAVSSVNVALPSIEAGIGASDADVQWVLSGYALAFGLPLIAAGRAGDVLGRSTVFCVGVGIFSVASLVCGLAPDPLFLNIARLFQGLGAAMVNPTSTGIIQQYFSGIGRARAFALMGVTVSVAVAIGPVLAGTIIATLGPDLGWRASFLLNAPIGLAGLILAFYWLPFETERRRRLAKAEGTAERTRIDLDPFGTVLLSAVVLCVMLPFMTHSGWIVWLLPVLGFALLTVWVMWERRYKAAGNEPMVDLDLFRIKSFSLGSAVGGTYFVGGASIFAVLALFVQFGPGASALETGILGVPAAVASGAAAFVAGRWALAQGRRLIVGGLVLVIVGVLVALLMSLTIAASIPGHFWLALPMTLVGFGAGIVTACNQTLAMQEVPVAHGGTAGGVKATAERIGTAIGNAMITGVLFGVVSATGDWSVGFAAANGVVVLAMLVSLSFALVDLRRTRLVR